MWKQDWAEREVVLWHRPNNGPVEPTENAWAEMVYEHCPRFSQSLWLHFSQLLDMSCPIEQVLGKVIRSGWQPSLQWDKSFLRGCAGLSQCPLQTQWKSFPIYFLSISWINLVSFCFHFSYSIESSSPVSLSHSGVLPSASPHFS